MRFWRADKRLMKDRKASWQIPIRIASLWIGLALPALLTISMASGARSRNRDAGIWSLSIRWSGMDARSLEERLALPLEEGLAGLKGFMGARLTCTGGELRGRLQLADRETASRVSLFLDSLHASLPGEVPRPLFSATDPDERPFWLAAVESGGDDSLAILLRDALLALEGVGACEVSGLGEEEILIVPDEQRLQNSSLSLTALVEPLRFPGRILNAGTAHPDIRPLPVRLSMSQSDSVKREVLSSPARIPLFGSRLLEVGDLGEARWVRREPSSRSYLDGESLVMISVTAAAGIDKRVLSKLVADRLNRFRAEYPGARIEVLDDEGRALEESWRELLGAAVVSLLLVFLASFIICRLRSSSKGGVPLALLCAICVPLVILFAVILMLYDGQRLDRTLLTALAISSGFSIDAFLVVIEMLFAHVSAVGRTERSTVTPALTRNVGRILISSAGTTLIALVPLCMAGDTDLALIGKTLFATSLVSLFVAHFFLLPMVGWIFDTYQMAVPVVTPKKQRRRRWHRLLAAVTRSLYAHRLMCLGLCALFIIVSLVCLPFALDRTPPEDSDLVPFSLSFEPGTGKAARSRRLAEFSKDVCHLLGDSVTVWASLSGDQARGSVRRDSPAVSGDLVLDALRSVAVEGGSVHAGLQGGSEHWWEVCVFSTQSEAARKTARELAQTLDSEAAVLHFRQGDPLLLLVPNRHMAVSSGFDLASMSGGLRRLLDGIVVGKVAGSSGEHDVRLSSAARKEAFNDNLSLQVDELKAAQLALGDGRSFSVGSLFSFSETVGPAALEREDRQALARLSFATKGSSMATARRSFARAVARINIPPQTRIVFDPEASREAQDTRCLVALIFVAALFCVLFLGCIENSLRGPLLCLLSLLPALSSCFPVLLLCALRAGPPALCGAILLSGLGINASILCLERLEGRPPSAGTIYLLWRDRMPLVMTTSLTSVFSCLPFALLAGPSAALARELSIVCIAGILVSAISSLIFLPLVRGLFVPGSALNNAGT